MRIKRKRLLNFNKPVPVYCMTVNHPNHEVLMVGQSGIRYRVKQSVNFGSIYIGSHFVLMRVAKMNYGVTFSEDEATAAWNAFHNMYPGIRRWHEESEEFFLRYGVAISPYGRVRRAPQILMMQKGTQECDALIRELLNATVQPTCGDFLAQMWTRAGIEIRRRKLDKWIVDYSTKAFPVLTVHDNVIFDAVHKDVAMEVGSLIAEACKYWSNWHRAAGWLKCDMKVDFELGDHWGAVEEIDVLETEGEEE